MCGSSSKPKVTTAPTVAPAPAPELTDDSVRAARNDERRKAMAAAGRKSTLLTGEGGLADAAPVQRKTLLGG